jgi:hypothetical protein
MNLRLILVIALCLVQTSVSHKRSGGANPVRWEDELARLNSILKTLPSDLDKTTFLRVYTGELIDIGLPDDQTNQFYQSIDLESFNLNKFYGLFKQDKVPAACGVTSYFYIKLLQTFGFKAYQYSFGFKQKPYQRFIHSVALVEIDYKGTRRLIIQDPYLDLTYRNKDQEPIDFFNFLTLLKQRQYDAIVMDPSTSTTFLLVPDPSAYYPHLNNDCKKLMTQAFQQDNGTWKTKIPIARDYKTLMQSPCDNFEQAFVSAMHESGYQEPFLYAYTMRASEVVGSSDHGQVQQQIDAIVKASRDNPE